MRNSDVSLYFHIPFCRKKCAYCAFFSTCAYTDDLLDAYLSALKAQISSFPAGFCARTIYFGGGTPSVFGENRIFEILNAVSKACTISSDCEITLEANPGTISPEAFRALRATGINRLSLGLQSSDETMLRFLGRPHTAEDFRRAFVGARNAGFENISADIIFALPRIETYAGLQPTLEFLRELQPEHISAYSLTIEPQSVFGKRKESLNLLDEDSEEREYAMICDFCAESNYTHYEISSFAKAGYSSRHNTVYWKRGDYIGLGAAAHSFYQGKRFSSPPDIRQFIALADHGFLAPTDFAEAHIIGAEEAEEERIMLGLRLREGVFISSQKQIKKAERYTALGFGKLEKGIFSLNERGFRVSNAIIADLLTK